MSRTRTPATVTTVNYESVGEYVAAMSDMSRRPRHGIHESSGDTGRPDFYWSKTFPDACRIQREGWQEGADKVARHREGFTAFIAAAVNAKSVQPSWDVCGQWYDPAKFFAGEPEYWYDERHTGEQASSRVVSIRLNNCVSAAVDPNIIVARGLAVLVAVDLLEACGIRCEVVIGTATKGYDGTLAESNVIVKRAGDNAEPNALAFNIAHPSFFRRFGFRFMELHGHSPSACIPCPMSDCGTRQGVVELDELLSGVRLDAAAVMRNVLAIAAKCGLDFTPEQMEGLIAASR
jgi:hypothetical protein